MRLRLLGKHVAVCAVPYNRSRSYRNRESLNDWVYEQAQKAKAS